MDKRSIDQLGETLPTKTMTAVAKDENRTEEVLYRKIGIVTEGFTTDRFCELVLRDRNRLSKENALTRYIQKEKMNMIMIKNE
jgi:hypothetical protein